MVTHKTINFSMNVQSAGLNKYTEEIELSDVTEKC